MGSTSYHVLTSRPSPCHATSRPQVTSLSCHVTSPMLRHVPTSRPFRHGLPTSRQVPQATFRPHVTSRLSSYITPPTPRPIPQVTSLASHLPRHVTSFASSRPSHITSRPTPRHFTSPHHVPHVTKSSRHVPPHVTYRALRHVPPPRHILSPVTSRPPRLYPPSRHPFD